MDDDIDLTPTEPIRVPREGSDLPTRLSPDAVHRYQSRLNRLREQSKPPEPKSKRWIELATALVLIPVLGKPLIDNIAAFVYERPHNIPGFSVHEFSHPTGWPELFASTILMLITDGFLFAGVYYFGFKQRADLPRYYWFATVFKLVVFGLLVSGLSRPVIDPAIAFLMIFPLWLLLRQPLWLQELVNLAGLLIRVTDKRQRRYEQLFERIVGSGRRRRGDG